MERIVSATEARVRFGEMMRRVVEDAEAIIVERDGKRQVALISIDEYELFKAQKREEPEWQTMLAEVHELIARELGDRGPLPADEVIHQMREERDAHIQDLLR